MRKILTIAIREYRAMVGTKAFLASIIMMPILMCGGIIALEILQNVGEIKERKIAVADATGQLFSALKTQAEIRNRAVENMAGKESELVDSSPGSTRDEYILEEIDASKMNDELRIELSDRIKNQDLYAFVEIPEQALNSELLIKEMLELIAPKAPSGDPNTESTPTNRETSATAPSNKIRFFAQDSSLSEAKSWISQVINSTVKENRLREAGIPPLVVQKASTYVPVIGMGLVERATDGTVSAAKESDVMTAIFLPMGVMMMMFMVIFMASQPMLESVLEEKSQRIAEVLLGSANPMQLMTGKLIGTVAGSLTVFIIYLGGAFLLCAYRGWTDKIPFEIVPWFVIFQVVGVLFYAAIFMAIGASVSQLKEAQSMLLPVWMLLMSPMFVWIFIVRDPLGPLATGFSLFPPATPTTMMLRMATGTTIPLWQPLLGMVLTMISTMIVVYIASRIFRVGILWQGKTPKISEILKWAFSGD